MANIKISDMTRATSVGGSDLLPIVQGGQSKSIEYKNMNKYSTSEQVVGTWIDGKPLYEKTFTITSIPQVTTDGTAVDTKTNIDQNADFAFLKIAFAVSADSSMSNYQTLPYISNSGRQLKTQMTNNNGNLAVNIVSNGTAYNSYYMVVAVVNYTKSTDSAS